MLEPEPSQIGTDQRAPVRPTIEPLRLNRHSDLAATYGAMHSTTRHSPDL